MKLANQQKLIVGIASAAVAVLLVTTLWSRPDFGYKQPTPDEQQALRDSEERSLAEYREYLKSINIDPVASNLIFDAVFDQEAIARDIRNEIGADKPVAIPQIKTADLRVEQTNDPDRVTQYLADLQGRLDEYHAGVTPRVDQVLTEFPDRDVAQRASADSQSVVDDLYALSVPQPAVAMHSAVLSAYTTNAQLFADAKQAAGLDEPAGQWKHLNNTHVAMRTQLGRMDKMVQELEQYAQTGTVPEDVAETNVFIPVARAAGLSGTVILKDIPRRIEAFLKSAQGAAVINFTRQALTKYVKNAEQNFLISNYLYYTNALVNTKYANDYLNKFVENPDDREMIKKFLPEFNCSRATSREFQKTLQAKAIEFLGFDPKFINASDPDFYNKMLKLGDPKADTTGAGFEKFYASLAAVAEAQANKAANQELAYSGKKVPIDPKTKDTVASLDTIQSQQRAATDALFSFTASNAAVGDFGFDKFVINSITAILKQFTIKGAIIDYDPKTGKTTVTKASPVTLKEQRACVAVPVVNPIIPGDFTPRKGQPTQEEIQLCIADPDDCQGILFQNPYDNILDVCPDLVHAVGPNSEERVLTDGLRVAVSPTLAKIGTSLEINYQIQPVCGYITEYYKQDTQFSLTVYGGDFVPTDRCTIPTDPNDLNQTWVVDTYSQGSQLSGHVVIDSELIATRYLQDTNGRYLRDENRQLIKAPLHAGKQVIVLRIIGTDDESGAALCLNGKAEVQLELPDTR
jgi:hypothetical protein